MAIHQIDTARVRNGLHFVNHLVNIGAITEANLGGLTTVAGLKAAVEAATVRQQDEGIRRQGLQAIEKAKNAGALTDAEIATVGGTAEGSRIAALRSEFTEEDSSLTPTDSRTFAF